MNLDQIKWRLLDEKMFKKVIAVLKDRLVYHQNVWSYALLHKDVEAAREYLHNVSWLVASCQPVLHSALLDVEWQGNYEHLEYSPLVNERAHRKKNRGGGADIDNPQFRQQYQMFLEVLAYKPSLDASDLLALTYYLVLQDRVDEVYHTLFHQPYKSILTTPSPQQALQVFQGIPHPSAETGKGKEKEGDGRKGVQASNCEIQYDYLQAYLDFFSEKPSIARDIALKYKEYPIPAWNKRYVFNLL